MRLDQLCSHGALRRERDWLLLCSLHRIATSPWRVRRFTYNSLSQLLAATNPESGTINYSYNDDGVLTSKTDARGITINYNPSESPIDVLHRVTKKTYSNGDPAVTYSYDSPSAVNGIGFKNRNG